MEGEFFRGLSLSEEDVRGSLFVSSVLLNMLLHVTPGRWLRGEFSEREFVLVGIPVKMGSLYVNSKLLKCYDMLHLDVGGGGDLSGGFLRGVLVHSLLLSLMIC